MKKITFLFGAGCEGNGQYDMPSGIEFKKKTIFPDNIKEFIKKFNFNRDVSNKSFISHNSTSILVQSINESENNDFLNKLNLSKEELEVVHLYLKKAEEKDYKAFLQIYKDKIYEPLRKYSEQELEELSYLDDLICYSTIDSYFNYLRFPNLYNKQINRIFSLYYSAYKCIYERVIGNDKILNIIFDSRILRKELVNLYEQAENRLVINMADSTKNTYYNTIKKLYNSKKYELNFVTTNYTEIAEKTILPENDVFSYIHGKMNLFESINTKRIGKISDFSTNEEIIPFILIQSGIKPIISPSHIKEVNKAIQFIENADKVIVLGYSLNSDDEHIINILRERIRENKHIDIYLYGDDNSEYNKFKIKKLLIDNNNIVHFKNASEFISDMEKYIE